jgi:hypothetical protein
LLSTFPFWDLSFVFLLLGLCRPESTKLTKTDGIWKFACRLFSRQNPSQSTALKAEFLGCKEGLGMFFQLNVVDCKKRYVID